MTAETIENLTRTFLMDLIRIPSTRGNEGEAAKYVYQAFKPLVDQVELLPIDDSIMEDPHYAFPLPGFTYKDSFNVECVIRGKNPDKTVVFNAHLDVVPPNEGQIDPFKPKYEDGIIFGRGACDDKGPLASLYALALFLKEENIQPDCNLIFHFVVEEENGGNGTLAMVRRGVEADAAIVLEATDFVIYPAVRGAVWFTLEVYGRESHSGNTKNRISAIDKAFQAIQALKQYHQKVLNESRGIPLFDTYEDPMPLTIGQFDAGVWPASVPNKAVLKGLMGFLPNMNKKQIQDGLRNSLATHSDEWLRENFKLEFNMLNNDGYMIPIDAPVVQSLTSALKGLDLSVEIKAMTASCDAWFYNNLLNIPTVVFGPGSLIHAHARDEQIKLDDVLMGAQIFKSFIEHYSDH
ncbi:MAG: M20 family metallopeptidase [Brevefilum fermentans]|jgi:acetylornithine deacetylase|uniref:Putative Acetylornithine deacetylase n=1 Tax=Candidatus Brevifilum fermentans TaxID=1986204 RepID=A0A1Y6K0E6_9CHLR|nr:M20/M25/M40 family metallo-hydrolase [Brevefilum fermentans]SMX53172.1 putative Acetylornithine deacetylase [Brevefilum fermentans]